jgi:hypothetical protein
VILPQALFTRFAGACTPQVAPATMAGCGSTACPRIRSRAPVRSPRTGMSTIADLLPFARHQLASREILTHDPRTSRMRIRPSTIPGD